MQPRGPAQLDLLLPAWPMAQRERHLQRLSSVAAQLLPPLPLAAAGEMRWTQTKAEAGEQWTLVNGELMQEKNVKLSRQDADGFIHGCFDTTRTFGGVPFRVEEHIDRLFATMNFLGITSPFTKAELVAMNHKVKAISCLKTHATAEGSFAYA